MLMFCYRACLAIRWLACHNRKCTPCSCPDHAPSRCDNVHQQLLSLSASTAANGVLVLLLMQSRADCSTASGIPTSARKLQLPAVLSRRESPCEFFWFNL